MMRVTFTLPIALLLVYDDGVYTFVDGIPYACTLCNSSSILMLKNLFCLIIIFFKFITIVMILIFIQPVSTTYPTRPYTMYL